MADALFLLVVVGFFGLMVLLVKACDHIVGVDTTPGSVPSVAADPGSDAGDLTGAVDLADPDVHAGSDRS
jgi:hypothetical protein